MIYECQSCETKFHDTDQSRSEQRDGQCPSCGSEDLKVVADRRTMKVGDMIAGITDDGEVYLYGMRPNGLLAFICYMPHLKAITIYHYTPIGFSLSFENGSSIWANYIVDATTCGAMYLRRFIEAKGRQ